MTFFPIKLPATYYGSRPGFEPGFPMPKPFIISILTKELQNRRGALNTNLWSLIVISETLASWLLAYVIATTASETCRFR